VAKSARHEPPSGSGFEGFEFWLPQRRPGGKNLACRIAPPLSAFEPTNLINGFARPTNQPNAWLAEVDDASPTLILEWPYPVTLGLIELGFDPDFDHPLETVLVLNPETVSPFCVPRVQALNEAGELLGEICDNHLSVAAIQLATPVSIRRLTLRLTSPVGGAPSALFRVSCFGPESRSNIS
jgi:hypothetical protein